MSVSPSTSTLFSAPVLLAKAREITGIQIEDSSAAEALSILCKSYSEEVRFNENGAEAVERYLLRMLCNRLRMQRDFAAHPEILEETLKPPVVISGMARTGSTKTHKLLAASNQFNFMTCWQSLNPSLISGSRDESPQQRIEDCDRFVHWLNTSSPTLRYTHELATHEPEEETWLSMHSLQTPMVFAVPEMTSYPAWLMGRDFMVEQLTFMRNGLKYLQWQGFGTAGKPWVLKTPYYYGWEVPIKTVFPDARLVMTHRHPKETIPSVCSLLQDYQTPVTDVPLHPENFVAGVSMQIHQHLENRRNRSDIEWLDIDYRELVTSVEQVAKRIFDYLGIPLTEAALQRMSNWDKSNRFVKGGHKYSLDAAGMTEEQISDAFKDYIALLGRLFEK